MHGTPIYIWKDGKVVDTNAVSDLVEANQRLLNRLQQSAEDIHLPVIVLGEYRYG
jgi:predicted nucleic acid-binding protein